MTKKQACLNALKYLPEKGTIGVGGGSTIRQFIKLIPNKKLKLLCADKKSELTAKQQGFKVVNKLTSELIISFDGADWVNDKKQLIKGYGKALLKEKIIDYNSRKVIIIIEQHKKINRLLTKQIPIEVKPIALNIVKRKLKEKYKAKIKLIKGLTENNNQIILCNFPKELNVKTLENELNKIKGVMENGLFTKKEFLIITD